MKGLFPLVFSFSALAYLMLGSWVVMRRKEKVQRLYGLLCIATCLWQGIWAALFTHPQLAQMDFFLKGCFTGVVFVPAFFHHFMNRLIDKNSLKYVLFEAFITFYNII